MRVGEWELMWCKRAWKRVGPGGACQGPGAADEVGEQRLPWVS